jgi:hypothetical protein
MIRLLRREFEVELPLERAWRHLARVESWPSWAGHIVRVELRPPGALGASTSGTIHLRHGIRSTFVMTVFHPHRRWTWVGRFLWLTVAYDHAFEAVGPERTRLEWTVDGGGFGAGVIGPLFARIYARNLDRAIPRLVDEMKRAASEDGN